MPIWSCPSTRPICIGQNKQQDGKLSETYSSRFLGQFCPSMKVTNNEEPSGEVIFTINNKVFKESIQAKTLLYADDTIVLNSSHDINVLKAITRYSHGCRCMVSNEVPVDTSLNTFLRKHAHLPGTKSMCQEGGCGACVVAARRPATLTQPSSIHAVNSCLVPVFACHGWDVMTVEGITDQSLGYHPLQTLLASHNGSQCGYCSPGFVMNMYSLVENNPKATKKEIEESFDGNICRCTGYRPILEAFKSIANEKNDAQHEQYPDVEDVLNTSGNKCKITSCNENSHCKGNCLFKTRFEPRFGENRVPQSVVIRSATGSWYRPKSKKDIFDILKTIGSDSYRFVAGNTANGVYRDETAYQHWIDVGGVPELRTHALTDNTLTVGINTQLSQLIVVLQQAAEASPALFQYTTDLANHIALVANVPVRNGATLAGNLYIKRFHHDFPSDLFLLLETVGAQITFEKSENKSQHVSPMDFLSLDMNKVLLTSVKFPPLPQDSHVVKTFKIMPRTRSVHASVNAGFSFKLEKSAKFKILEKPRLVYGNISSSFVHARKTEELLEGFGKEGKGLLDKDVLDSALKSLRAEIKSIPHPPGASPEYRDGLAVALFYKFVLGLNPKGVNPLYRSGGSTLLRPISSSKREYDTDKTFWPINKPVPKVEAIYQCSGEAQYTDDMPTLPGELHSALVLTTVAKGRITSIDPSAALALPGVVAFYSAKDIPGINSFTSGIMPEDEPVFCGETVLYHGQPVGLLLAESQKLALKAVSKVAVSYSNTEVPVIDMKEVIEQNITSRIVHQAEIVSKTTEDTKAEDDKVTVRGWVYLPAQYHLTMELQTCVCVPVEDGMDVYSSTQWMEYVHNAVSKVLNMPAHRINMKVRRLGGGYGAKLTRATWIAAICAIAAKLSNRPVRTVLDLQTNMRVMGKRYPCYTTYEAEVMKATGKIVKMTGNLAEEAGWSGNDPVVDQTLAMLPSCYDSTSWNIKGSIVKTDKPSNTWCRSPGSAEAIGTIEVIMENIAETVGLDPVQVRLANMAEQESNPVPGMVEYWKQYTEYRQRLEEVNKFNKENMWKKKGLSLVPMTYKLFLSSRFNATVTIYAVDGTVAISHGGIECGQGINTKVIQVCAYGLEIDMSMIQVKPTDIFISPNNEGSGGSVSSESVCFAVLECCKILQERLAPIRKLMPSGYTWQQLIQKAYAEQVKLNSSYLFTSKDGVKNYDIYGVTVAEVEVDILTGQHLVSRVDILEDAGVSLSPEVDMGQVEGAFVMGLGYYTTENLEYNKQGALLTDRTWTYYPPGSLDIPVDFRIQLRKNAPNPYGVLRSKATGEPPLCMSVAIPLAIINAIKSSQIQDVPPFMSTFATPITPERVFIACNNSSTSYPI